MPMTSRAPTPGGPEWSLSRCRRCSAVSSSTRSTRRGERAFLRAFATCSRPRDDLRLVVTPALFDPCLHLYPMRAWEELEAKIAALPQFDPNVVAFRRRYVSAAVECELDKQGRILVPAVAARARRAREGRALGRHGHDGRALVEGALEGRASDERCRARELQGRDRGAVPPMNVVNVVPMRAPSPPPPPRAAPRHRAPARGGRRARAARRGRLRRRDARRRRSRRGASSRPRRATRVIGDRSRRDGARARARRGSQRFGDRVTLVHARFSEIEAHLARLGVERGRRARRRPRRELDAARRRRRAA